jgi:hypothetical protein
LPRAADRTALADSLADSVDEDRCAEEEPLLAHIVFTEPDVPEKHQPAVSDLAIQKIRARCFAASITPRQP